MALGRERRHELWITLIAIGGVEEGLEEPARRLGRAGRGEIETGGFEDLGDVPLETGAVPIRERARQRVPLVEVVALVERAHASQVRMGSSHGHPLAVL